MKIHTLAEIVDTPALHNIHYPPLWEGDTFGCPSCGERYPDARRDAADVCMGALWKGEWPPMRHHWPNGLPLSLEQARFWYAVGQITAAEDDDV